jgi:N-acetylglucosaminyl-diphospho-decaprenol L-rhamnosyltransferase
MSPRISIDVVIPTYQGQTLLERCLRHLEKQTVPHTVIVSDNGSTDGTPQFVRRKFPAAQLLELRANLGFSVACNRGAEASNGDVIVLVNNDVECRPDFLERLVAPFTDDASVGSVAPLLVQAESGLVDSVGLTADCTLAGFPRLQGQLISEATKSRPPLTGPSGGAAAYRRTAWNEAGGFDEGVSFYLEDLDLALRLASAGWKTAAAPDAVAVHRVSASMGRRSAWQRRHAGFSRAYFIRRYGLLRSRVALRVLATEALVIVADALVARDLQALRGRLAGWSAARTLERRARPPADAIDGSISFQESLRLRRRALGAAARV